MQIVAVYGLVNEPPGTLDLVVMVRVGSFQSSNPYAAATEMVGLVVGGWSVSVGAGADQVTAAVNERL
jgi:hypothetical protein